ncbi:MAG: hypothetical protein AB1696_18585 [Planctomycetota bacterium]
MRRIMQVSALLLFASLFCFGDEEHKIALRVKEASQESAPEITLHMEENPVFKIVVENNSDRPFHYRAFPDGRIQGLSFTLLWRSKIIARTNGFRPEQKLQVLKPKEKVEQVIAFGTFNILPGPWRAPKGLRSGDYMAQIELEQARPPVPDTPPCLRKAVRIVVE